MIGWGWIKQYFFTKNLLLSDISSFSQKKPITEPYQPREKNLDPDTQHLVDIKGTVSRDFCFWFFSWISFPPAPEYPIRTVSKAWGKMIHEKNQKSKISWHCFFKRVHILYTYTYTLYIVVNKKLRYPTLPPCQPHVTALLVSPREENPYIRCLGAKND